MDDESEANYANNLVYPKIENIFSNIGNIKTEVPDYEDNDFESTEMLDYDSSNEYYMPIPNKIIIGSKPSSSKPETAPEPSTSTWVERQRYQCDQCPVSFSSQAQLHAHSISHSFLVARTKAVSSPKPYTSPPNTFPNISSTKNGPKRTVTKLKKSFAAPKKTLPKDPFKSKDKIENSELICEHCNIPFPNEAALIQHKYELIPDKSFKCPVTWCYQSFNTKIELAAHKACHIKKGYTGRKLLQCQFCSLYLKFPTVLRNHLLKCHNVTEFALNYVKFNGKCPYCPRSLPDNRMFNKHIANIHYKLYLSKISVKNKNKTEKTLAKTKFSELCKNLSAKNMPVPRQTLYKCNKCQIHFVTCTMAYKHSRQCVLVKGDWKCDKCRRAFIQEDRNIHTLQHEITDKFKVHIVNERTFSQVLCKCPRCELHFNEVDFFNHIAAGCTPSQGFDCGICKLNFHRDSRAIHTSTHKKYNYARADYIIVEYASLKSKEERQITKDTLRYCTNCKTNQFQARLLNYHLTGECKRLKVRVCQICGLLFTVKALESHMKTCHQRYNLRLHDFTFIRLQDNVVIAPPIPDYFKCHKCNVLFASALKKRMHDCKSTVSVKCKKCSKKYEELSYKLHLSFHEYKMPASGYNAESLKIFSCAPCNIGFDSYDSLIHHCQNHFTNTQAVADNHCKVCKLKFYESHVTHGEEFIVFKFHHDTLLTDEWLNGFGSLSIDEIDKVLSKSVHGDVRNVRLKLLKNGPPERSLYKCAQCELYFNADTIAEHASKACSKTPRYSCSSCHAVFNTALCLRDHLDTHVIFGDDIDFREIVFNNTKDRDLNDTLRTGRTKESLKFRKCPVCELLIKKNDYELHIAAHNEATNKPTNPKSVKQVGSQRKFVVYKCKHCPAVIMNKANLSRHTCWGDRKTVVCEKCSLEIRTRSLNQHNHFHATKPTFVTKNITVIKFESGVPLKTRKRRHSEAEDYKNYKIDSRKSKGVEKENRNEDKSLEVTLKADTESTPQYTSSPYGTRKRRTGIVPKDVKATQKATIDVQALNIDDSMEASSLSIDKWLTERNKLYQCDKCYLCFMNRRVLIGHVLKCANFVETPLSCNQCGLTFHPSQTQFHEALHNFVNTTDIENSFFLINISTKGRLQDDSSWVYKCKKCDLYYLSYSSLCSHIQCEHKTTFETVTCDVCGLKFTTHSIAKHKRIHHGEKQWTKETANVESFEVKIVGSGDICLTRLDSASNSDRIVDRATEKEETDDKERNIDVNTAAANDSSPNINITEENVTKNNLELSETDPNRTSYLGVDNHLYKCTTCDIHYITKRTLELHVNSSDHLAYRSKCTVCGLDFGTRTVIKHINVQHKMLRLARKDFILVSLEGEVLKDDLNVFAETNVNNEKDTREELHSAEVISPLKTGVKNNNLYKCANCRVHFMIQNQLVQHIANNHEMKDIVDCDVCDLRFEAELLPSHKSKQHDDLKLSVTDFEILNETGVHGTEADECSNDLRSESCVPSINTDEMVLDEIENVTDGKRRHKKIQLYQCKNCKVCIRKAQTKTHVCYSDIRKKQCILCTLFFSRADYFDHKRLHNRFKLSRKDFLLVKFGLRTGRLRRQRIYKCQACSIHFLSLMTLESHIDRNHKCDKVSCDICGLDFAKISIDRHINMHHGDAKQNKPLDVLTVHNFSNTKEDSITLTDNIKLESVTFPPNSKCIKLFKCVECDVYFLTQSSYYKHLYKHEPLDPTEFMACKMCELQFLTEALAEHLKSHKDKVFSLDKVLIESFQPETNQSVIQGRLGEDVNFKQVSTTTPFVDDSVAQNSEEQQSTVDSTSKIDLELSTDVGTQ